MAPAAERSTPSTWPYREVGCFGKHWVSFSLGLPVGQPGPCWSSFQAPSSPILGWRSPAPAWFAKLLKHPCQHCRPVFANYTTYKHKCNHRSLLAKEKHVHSGKHQQGHKRSVNSANAGCSIPSHCKFAKGEVALKTTERKEKKKERGKEKKKLSSSRQKLCGSRPTECLPDDLLVTLIIASHLVSGAHKAWPFARAGRRTNWPNSGDTGPPDTAEPLVSVWLRRTWHSFVNCQRLIYPAIWALLSPALALPLCCVAQPEPQRWGESSWAPSCHKHTLARVRSGQTRMLSTRTTPSFKMGTSG